MIVNLKRKPRIFKVGFDNSFTVKDFGQIKIKNNEQITFIHNKKKYDFGSKDWGYYATSSINKRLKESGYKTFLVKNILNKIYVMAVDKNKIKEFEKYLKNENQRILLRLDNFKDEENFAKNFFKYKKKNKYCLKLNCKKEKKKMIELYNYKKPPPNEPNYNIENYKRKIIKCSNCNHFYAIHKIDTTKFYKKAYSVISHGKNIYKKFKKIQKLGKNSDNFHRVSRFLNFFKKLKNKKISLLDVGSGISIFLNEIKKHTNWKLTGVEPDINFVKFGREKLKLNIIHSSLNSKALKRKKFDLISMNKVVEHVKNPISFITDCKKVLNKNGYIYIEVPDGLTASEQSNSKYQEEFAVDHLHVFSIDSLFNTLKSCNLDIIKIDKICEKSGKFTLYAFAKKNDH